MIMMATDVELEDEEEEREEYPPDEEAPSLSVESVVEDDGADNEVDQEAEQPPADEAAIAADVSLLEVPDDLHPDRFFQDLISAALDRTPIGMYKGVRERIAQAKR